MNVLLGAFLLSSALMVTGSHFRSDYVYHSSAQGWFKFHHDPATWEDARLQCSLEGAILASPINVDMSDVMHSIISKTGHSCASPVYTGIHNTIASTDFSSIEGVPLTKMYVGKSETFCKASGSPICIRMDPKDGLVAGSCSDVLPYLCYKKKTEELLVTECGTTDRAYQYDNRTGHCYKFHGYTLSWALAYLTCAAEGGYLAIPNSATEGTLIRELFDQNPPETIRGRNRNGIHLGFYDWQSKGIWRTIHGQSLEEAGFAQWSENQPDNAPLNGQGQHCGSMFRTGLLDDVWCDYMYPFICEKDPKTLREVHNQCQA